MKRLLLFIGFLIFCNTIFSQSNWITKVVGNNIVVKFPNNPEYKLTGKAGAYTSKTSNNVFVVLVQYSVIPNYSDFVNLSHSEQTKLIELFLDNAIKGMLASSGSEGTSFKSIQVGRFQGREASYNAINPLTGESGIRYCRLLYAFNKVYTFQCLCLRDEAHWFNEKNTFLNSISIDQL